MVRAGSRKRFLASCCVSVEPPWVAAPAAEVHHHRAGKPDRVDAEVAVEPPVLDRHHRLRQRLRHLGERQRFAAGVAAVGDRLAGLRDDADVRRPRRHRPLRGRRQRRGVVAEHADEGDDAPDREDQAPVDAALHQPAGEAALRRPPARRGRAGPCGRLCRGLRRRLLRRGCACGGALHGGSGQRLILLEAIVLGERTDAVAPVEAQPVARLARVAEARLAALAAVLRSRHPPPNPLARCQGGRGVHCRCGDLTIDETDADNCRYILGEPAPGHSEPRCRPNRDRRCGNRKAGGNR